jgi:hypothetical protein
MTMPFIANLRVSCLAILLVGCGMLADSPTTAQEDPPEAAKLASEERGLSNRLVVYQPVPIHGPYPYLLYTARTGDFVELQLSYPVKPPFPERIAVRFDPRYFKIVEVVATEGEVAVLQPGESQEGVLGVGYYSLFAKPLRDGDTRLDVKVTLENGDSESVPFNFRIGPERKAVSRPEASK